MADDTTVQSLTEPARRLYAWILERGEFDAQEAQRALGLSDAARDEAVRLLAQLRLLRRLPDGRRVVAGRPDVAAAELIGPLERQMQGFQRLTSQIHSDFDALMSLYLARDRRERGLGKALDRLTDPVGVNARIDELSEQCTEEVLTMQPGGGRPTTQLDRAYPRDLAMLSRGVRIRSLYQHSARFDARTRSYVDDATRHGAEVRTVRELSNKMVVFDRRTAFIPAGAASGRNDAMIVREPAVVAFLCGLFEQVWDRGVDFAGEIRSQDQERALANSVKSSILRLLVQGVRDEAIARRMGISVRTCRRHIAEIMETTGAESRFQAGYLVAGRQLLDAQD
ncbi:helix-turn-helix transcriptional regulator [Streptomyces pratensis]|uniref:helix-turn-helix transcriptional regulator n=1 Tax=Streptomyces pratensis TaxID=1169025 RepID=UPI003017B381